MQKKLAHAVIVAMLAALAACSPTRPTPTPDNKCSDPLASNNGQVGTCTYAPVTLVNLVYHRTVINNVTRTEKDAPAGWTRDDNLTCTDAKWDIPSQNWTCPELKDVSVGKVTKMWITDGARAVLGGDSGTASVCSDVSVNGTMLKSTKEGSREFCYFKADAAKNVTSTDAAGNPK